MVSWYRQQLDRALAARGSTKSSSGHSSVDFEPDVNKTFNRGYTSHFLHGRQESPGAIDSPKMVGEYVGTVSAVQGQRFVLDTTAQLHNGDGLCWFDPEHELCGTFVNAVQPDRHRKREVAVMPVKMAGIHKGLRIYRNHDHDFLRQVRRSQPIRKMHIHMRLETVPEGFVLHVEDEDGNIARTRFQTEKVPAEKPERAEAVTRRQLSKTGDTPYLCTVVELGWDQPYYMPLAALNALRREALARLDAERAANRPKLQVEILRNDIPFPEVSLTYRGNVLNRRAEAFYERHGVKEIAPAAESGLSMDGKVIMRTRYCIKHQLGLCDGTPQASRLREPLYLVDEDGHHYQLRFDCADCEMSVLY